MKVYIVYEVFNREYDNCLLLKKALEREHYFVTIVYKMNLLSIKPSDEKTIVFIPNCYDDSNFEFYYYLCGLKNAILINMQYEQVLSDDEKNIDAHTPRGRAAYIYNLCWGKGFSDFLTSVGINPSLSFVGGALQLDFMRDEFFDFWIEKETIANQYSLPINKRWSLFISSFAYANNELVNRASDKVYGKNNNLGFRQLSNDSRDGILNWFSKYLRDNDDVIIYRKHPMEKYDERLLDMQSKYKGKFFLISDFNIKQWIYLSDVILNWYSTSAVECVVAKKSFEILRPIEVDEKTEVVFFKNARFIDNYDSFERFMNLKQKEINYPFDVGLINLMYEIDDKPSYSKIVDNIKRIENETYYCKYVDPYYYANRKKYIKKTHAKIKHRVKHLYQWLYSNLHIRLKLSKLRKKFDIDDWEFQARIVADLEKEKLMETIIARYYALEKGKNNV